MALTAVPSQDIVILGGSYGGISSAHHLLKHTLSALPEQQAYKVILVSASNEAMCRPACPRALVADNLLPKQKLFVSIPKQFEQYPGNLFRFVHGTATAVDHVNRTVSITLDNGEAETLGFFALVVATGASTPSPLLGLNRDAKVLCDAWAEFRRSLATAKSIVIAGGGPAGIETAGELGEYLNGQPGIFSGKHQSPKVPITVITAGSNILPALRPTLAAQAEQYLARVGVTVVKNTRVKSVDPPTSGVDIAHLGTKATLTLSDGRIMETDIFIPATGMTPNTSFLAAALLTPSGQIDTNPSTLRVEKAGPRVYAIGDASSYARPAVHNILAAVPVLGANIKRDLLLAAGKAESEVGPEKLFKEDKRETQMVPIGRSKGVGAAMGWRLPSWMVWLIKGRDYWLWTTGKLWNGKQWAKEA